MSNPVRSPRWFLGLIGAVAVAAVVCVACRLWRPAPAPEVVSSYPPPPFSDSRYLNTKPEVQYVGTDVCAGCHTARHASYLLTAHSQALSDLDPQSEPADTTFVHQASGRTYRVYCQGGQFRHQEVLRTDDGQEIARVDLPIRYLIGSGHFCRSYLVEVDGFLHESPLTWYTTKQQRGLSPGYDFAQHWSFERPIRVGCASCHAGRVEAAPGSVNRLTLREKAIGCENCHGPGSLHVAVQKAGKVPTDDLTIVNSAKLSRPLLEDVCAACHLNGPATVAVRGRRATDFRPGAPLTDYRTDYRFDSGSKQMTVVGHIEQMRQSKCYQQTKELTCITCHDPHQPEKPKDPVAFYRQKCLECHATKPCRLDETQRRKQQPADNCAACHMPRGDTDIPHIAFTHHRIGLHGSKPDDAPLRVPALVPTKDDAYLPALDRERNLGLAYVAVAGNPQFSSYASTFLERGRKLLEGVHAAGLRDADLAEALSETYTNKDNARAADYAREALAAKDVPGNVRTACLSLLAAIDMENGKIDSAIAHLQELVQLRRRGEDWRHLGECYLLLGEPAKALPTLEQALAIRPSSPAVHERLAEAYQKRGDGVRARDHQQKARWLLEHHQE